MVNKEDLANLDAKVNERLSKIITQVNELIKEGQKTDKLVIDLNKRLALMEKKITEQEILINKLKEEKNNPENGQSKIASNWVTVLSKNMKKPQDQLTVMNAISIEQEQKKRREKNIVIFGIPESSKEALSEKRDEDKISVKNVLTAIGKGDVEPVNTRRLRSKNELKPGPIVIELSDKSERNPILASAKKLKTNPSYKEVYLGPDMTEAERLLDFQLRAKRNELNSSLDKDSPFRYGIRGTEVIKFKIKSTI
jgi:hypothetical protein